MKEEIRKEIIRNNIKQFTKEEAKQYKELINIIKRAFASEDHSPEELENYLAKNKLSKNVASTINLVVNTSILEVK